MRNRILALLFVLTIFTLLPESINCQEDKLSGQCFSYLKGPYVSTGQAMRAFLTGDEVAEFHTTLYEGTIYRIVACSPKDDNIIFSVFDKDRNLLFNSYEHVNANFWDFKMIGSLECIIEARLNPKKGASGMAMIMIGFKGDVELK